MQPSIITTAAVLHFEQSWAPSGKSEFENASVLWLSFDAGGWNPCAEGGPEGHLMCWHRRYDGDGRCETLGTPPRAPGFVSTQEECRSGTR